MLCRSRVIPGRERKLANPESLPLGGDPLPRRLDQPVGRRPRLGGDLGPCEHPRDFFAAVLFGQRGGTTDRAFTSTDGDGVFEFTEIPLGPFTLEARAIAFSGRVIRVDRLETNGQGVRASCIGL